MFEHGIEADVSAQDILRAALDVSEDGFAVHRVRRDASGAIEGFTLVLINRAGAAPFDQDPGALAGADVADLLGTGGAPLLEAFRACAETGLRQQVRTTFSESVLAGTTVSTVVRVDADHLLSTWRDTTDQAVDEFILQESLRMRSDALRAVQGVLDTVGDAVVAVDLPASQEAPTPELAARSRVSFANRTAATALGRSAGAVTRSTLVELVGEQWARVLGELICDALRDGEASERIVVRDEAGWVQDGRVVSARVMGPGRVVVVSRDITDEEWAPPPV